jgi:hypothetical protein
MRSHGQFHENGCGDHNPPVAFFRSIARRGDILNPAVFAVIYALISAQLNGILGLIFAPLLAGPGDTDEAFAGGVGGFLSA